MIKRWLEARRRENEEAFAILYLVWWLTQILAHAIWEYNFGKLAKEKESV